MRHHVAVWLVRQAARPLPAALRSRFRDEWLAELDVAEQEGGEWQGLWWALRICGDAADTAAVLWMRVLDGGPFWSTERTHNVVVVAFVCSLLGALVVLPFPVLPP